MLVLQFILAFVVMLVLHELGHFLASKAFGIEIEEFGIGLPPRMVKLFTWKGTDVTLNWLPFGAFVRPKGEFDDPSENSLRSAPAWKQIVILLAGPAMNFLTAFILFTICVHQVGAPDPSMVFLERVEPDSPAETAGMQAGDQLLRIGNTDIESFDMVSTVTQENLDRPTPIRVSRNGEILDLTVTPLSNPPEGRGAMGVVITYAVRDIGLFESIRLGFSDTVFMTKSYLSGLGQIITGKVQMGLESIVGPVGMYSYYSEAAELDEQRAAEAEEHRQEMEKAGVNNPIRTASSVDTGWSTRLTFFGLISVALGVSNLFPIPGLDGGRILFLLPELLFKKKVPLKVETAFNGIFMALLVVLMVAVMFKDVFMLSQ